MKAKKPGPADYHVGDPWSYEKSRTEQLKKIRDNVYKRSARQRN